MARSNHWFALGFLVPYLAMAQVTPLPTDIPYAVNIKQATITDTDNITWSMDAGVVLNEPARQSEKIALQELRDQNANLQKQLQAKDDEVQANKITPEGWVGIALSTVGTVATAVATVVAATQKH